MLMADRKEDRVKLRIWLHWVAIPFGCATDDREIAKNKEVWLCLDERPNNIVWRYRPLRNCPTKSADLTRRYRAEYIYHR